MLSIPAAAPLRARGADDIIVRLLRCLEKAETEPAKGPCATMRSNAVPFSGNNARQRQPCGERNESETTENRRGMAICQPSGDRRRECRPRPATVSSAGRFPRRCGPVAESQSGSATKAAICAKNEHRLIASESEKIGMRIRSNGTNRRWSVDLDGARARRTKRARRADLKCATELRLFMRERLQPGNE